jgi:PAS domain S-box-containing protein
MRAEQAVSQSSTGILEYDTTLSNFADASSLLRARTEDRQRAEQALRESETRKSAILESALDAIIAMDQEGRIIDFNPGAEKLFGYRREEVQGRTVADAIIPKRFREAHWQGLRRFLETGQGSVLERRIEMPALRSDGSEFASELTIAVATLNNNQLIFTAYLRDITEQKRAVETEKILTRELEHRINNLLSVIDGIAQRSFSGNHTLEEARANFSARLRSLAQTQRELTKANWTGLNLIDIVRSKLEPVAARAG